LNCPRKKNTENKSSSQNSEILLMATEDQIVDNQFWIGDSGATSHMICSEVGMFETKASNQNVIVGDGQSLKIEKTGKLRFKFEGRNKELTDILLDEVKYISRNESNFFQSASGIAKGSTVHSEGKSLVIKK
jgi:hypothetical protein